MIVSNSTTKRDIKQHERSRKSSVLIIPLPPPPSASHASSFAILVIKVVVVDIITVMIHRPRPSAASNNRFLPLVTPALHPVFHSFGLPDALQQTTAQNAP